MFRSWLRAFGAYPERFGRKAPGKRQRVYMQRSRALVETRGGEGNVDETLVNGARNQAALA